MKQGEWVKSSASQESNCVEAYRQADGQVLMRNSRDKSGQQVMVFTQQEFEAFLVGAKAGEFDFE